jgi:hypothetical protein
VLPLQGPPDRGTQRTAHRPTAAPGHSQRLGACCRAPGLADEHLLCLASRVRRGGWSSPWCVAFCSGPLLVGGSAVGGVPFRSGKRVHARRRCRCRTSTSQPWRGARPSLHGWVWLFSFSAATSVVPVDRPPTRRDESAERLNEKSPRIVSKIACSSSRLVSRGVPGCAGRQAAFVPPNRTCVQQKLPSRSCPGYECTFTVPL